MDLSSLTQALKPLSQFGQDELDFEVDGTEVHLRPLLPREEVICQERAAEILAQAKEEEQLEDNDEVTRALSLKYFDQFRAEVIGFALVQVGPHDFRGLQGIHTGEVLDNGTRVQVPLQRALRDLINKTWSRAMLTICFAKYGDLVTKIAEKADRIARESISDLDEEVERLERRLKAVKEERAKRAKGDPSATTQQIQNLVSAGEALQKDVDAAIQASQEDRRLAEEIRQAAQEDTPPEPEAPSEVQVRPPAPRRQSVVPKRAPPPTAPPTPSPEDRIREAQEQADLIVGASDPLTVVGEGPRQREVISGRADSGGRGMKDVKVRTNQPKGGAENPHFKRRG